MKPEIAYTLGFAFDPKLMYVHLIQKKRGPSFNIGKWNGIGGKIEIGEGIRSCMAREFHEEAGVLIGPENWYCFHQETHLSKEQGLNTRLYCMTTVLKDEDFDRVKAKTDEPIAVFSMLDIFDIDDAGVYNLSYLVMMAHTWNCYPEHRWLEG